MNKKRFQNQTTTHSTPPFRTGLLYAVLASVIALGSASNAHALALGRISTSSHFGEPLAAEIDFAAISSEEAESLQVSLASPDAYRNLGLDYNSLIANLSLTTKTRNGKPYIEIRSTRPSNEVYFDLLLDVSSSSGRIQRNYTVLLNPSSVAAASPAAPTLITEAQAAPTPAAMRSVVQTRPPSADASAPATVLEIRSGDRQRSKKSKPIKPGTDNSQSKLVLSSAPSQLTPALKALAATTNATSQILQLKMSANLTLSALKTPAAPALAATNQGSVTPPAVVAAPTPQIPLATPAPAAVAPSAPMASAPAPAVSTTAAVPASNPIASAATSSPVATVSKAAAKTPAAPTETSPPFWENEFVHYGAGALLLGLLGWLLLRRKNKNPPQSQFDDSLAFFDQSVAAPENSNKPIKGINAGKNSGKKEEENSGYTVPPPPLEIDTISYSPSKLMTDDDVDPVLEADVYISYNRSEQAEKILMHAISQVPENPAFHAKLLEIFAARHDAPAFAQTIATLQKLTMASGPYWEKALDLQKTMDAKETNLELEQELPAPVAQKPIDEVEAFTLELEEPTPAVGGKWNATVQQAKLALVEELLLMGDKQGAKPLLTEITQKGDAAAAALAKQQLSQL